MYEERPSSSYTSIQINVNTFNCKYIFAFCHLFVFTFICIFAYTSLHLYGNMYKCK